MAQPFSWVSYTISTPTSGPFSYSAFLLLLDETVPEEDQFDVYVNGVLKVITTDYTVDTGAKTISFTVGHGDLAAADFLKIQRDTLKDNRYITWQDNTVLTADDLNLNSDQIFFIAQEAYDLAFASIRLGTGDFWDGQGKRITSGAAAVGNEDFVILSQVIDLVGGGGGVVTINNPISFTIAGYNAGVIDLTVYDADAAGITKVQVQLFLDGNRLVWDVDYIMNADGDEITLTDPIPDGSTLQGFWYPGTIAATYQADFVDTAALQARSVTGPKIALATVALENMAAESIDSDQYVDGSIDPAHLAALAVEEAAIAAGAVTKAKVADGINKDSLFVARTSPAFSPSDFTNSSGKLQWQTVRLHQVSAGHVLDVVLEMSLDGTFTDTVALDVFREGTTDGKSYTSLQGFVPAGAKYRVVSNGTSPTIVEWNYMELDK